MERKLKIYIDTSVIGGCFDEEFSEWSNLLFEEFKAGKKIAVISDVVLEELENAPIHVTQKIMEIPVDSLMKIEKNDESELLAKKYLEINAVPQKYFNDGLHIALATINNVDILVSWNFKHIVNYNRIILYNSVNQMMNYKQIEIRTPKEVLKYEEDF